MIPGRDEVTKAAALLVAAISGRQCGAHESPADAPYPFNVVHPIDMDFDGPPLTDPDESGEIVIQVDSVGVLAEQADRLADRVRQGLLARDAGAIVHPIELEEYGERGRWPGGGPSKPHRAGEGENAVWTVSERFVFSVTPK